MYASAFDYVRASSWSAAVAQLAERRINDVLLEAGPRLLDAFADDDLVGRGRRDPDLCGRHPGRSRQRHPRRSR